ncbi:MAG TPA: hypothetical protein VF406_00210 [Thermodesulfobacteriota bacterium]
MKPTAPRAALLLSLLAALACGDGSPTTPEPTTPADSAPTGNSGDSTFGSAPRTLAVLGNGDVPERYTAEVAERDGWAYTSTWGGFPRGGNFGDVVKIWDARSGTPALVDSLKVPGAQTLDDLQISDDGKLLVVATEYAGGSIIIYDRSDPARPVQLSKFTSANTNPGVHTVKLARWNDRHYAFLSVDPGGGRHAALVIVDITDPRAPREILARTMGNPYVHDVFVRDGILFTANWDDGLVLWDIGGAGRGGTVANPVQLGAVRTASYNNHPSVHNVWWFHDPRTGSKRFAFVGEENAPGQVGVSATGDIHVVDVSDFSKPREVAFYHVDGAGTHNFHMDEASGILYAAYYNAGVRALDVRGDLSSCTAAQKSTDGRCDLARMGRDVGHALGDVPQPYTWGVHFENGKLYASDMVHGLYVIDASPLVR